MKTFKRSSLPDTLQYKNIELRLDASLSSMFFQGLVSRKDLERQFNINGVVGCLVSVTNTRLSGKHDLHGNPYKPNVFVFTGKRLY